MLVFFSGGLDSVVLTYDVAKHPWRYGIEDEQDKTLILFSYGEPAKKRHLAPLVNEVLKVSKWGEVQHVVAQCPLNEAPRQKASSWQTLDPMVSGYRMDMMPHSPGLHLWLASFAVNLLTFAGAREQEEVALFGFQYNGPAWEKHYDGELPPNDTSPEFIESMNKLMFETGEPVQFRAPFLEWRLTKPLIVKMGREIGAPMKMSSSCREGWQKNCGVCGQCMLRTGLKL